MAKQIQKQKKDQTETEEIPLETPQVDASDTLKDTDAILDEIDQVLEVNAEEFVRAYVQKGGQ